MSVRKLVLGALGAALVTALLPCAAQAGEVIVGVTGETNPQVVRFNSDTPGTITHSVPVVGLGVGEAPAGVDLRPQTGQLYLLSDTNRMFLLDHVTGAAISVGSALDAAVFNPTQRAAVEFNPVVDRLRLTNPANDNLRYNPVTFAPVDGDPITPGVQGDTDLAFIASDPNVGEDPNVRALAYDRNDLDAGTVTTAFGIETDNDVLVRLGAINGDPVDTAGGASPNGGLLTTIGPLGVDVSDASMDIASTSTTNVGYAATAGPGASFSALRSINLATGQATLLGNSPALLAGLTVLNGGGLGVAAAEAAEPATQVVVRVTRSGDSLFNAAVDYRTVDGTATALQDYVATSGRLVFARGEASKDIVVPLIEDTAIEGTEAFSLALDDPTPNAVIDVPAATVRLTDNDVATPPPPPPGPPPPPPPPPPPDVIKPVLLVLPTAPSNLAALRRAGRLRVPYGCSEACRTSFTLSLGTTRLGSSVRTLNAAGTSRIDIRLTAAGKRAIDQARRTRGSRFVTLTLNGLAADRANNRTTTRHRLRTRR